MIKAILRATRRIVDKVRDRKGQEDYPYLHWTNDMDEHGGCDRCPIWAGRWWLHLTDRIEIHSQWLWFLPKRNQKWGIGFEIGTGDNDDDLQLNFYLPWICSIYTSVSGLIKPVDYGKEREWECVYHLPGEMGQWGAIFWAWGSSVNSWEAGTPKWRHCLIDLADLVLGRQHYTRELLHEGECPFNFVWQGERESYEATWKHEIATWVRPRWPRSPMTIVKTSIEIEVKDGVPIPGKGENSWDCGDGAIYSIGFNTDSLQEAGDRFVERVIERRERHGGSSWRPKAKEASNA